MSRKRNRSIRNLPLDNLALLKYPLPDVDKVQNNEKFCLDGTLYKDDNSIYNQTFSKLPPSEDSLESILMGIRDLSTDRSSSSSLSWGGDYRTEALKQIRDELEHMDRVLRQEEPIPPNYDEEEYKEWIEFFPNLCVLGSTTGKYIQKYKTSKNDYEEVIATDLKENCDSIKPLPDFNKTKMDVKQAITDQIFSKVSSKLITKKAQDTYDYCDDKNNNSGALSDCLKVSQIGFDKERLLHRQQSARSLISSQISSSKWLKDDDTDFNPLPFLVRNFHVKTMNVGKDKHAPPKGILKNSVVLPPIETNHFRSVSATPRRATKSLSALSVNGRLQNRLKTPNFLVLNSVRQENFAKDKLNKLE